jgi:hypothetical protein
VYIVVVIGMVTRVSGVDGGGGGSGGGSVGSAGWDLDLERDLILGLCFGIGGGMAPCACDEEDVGDVGIDWVCDGVGERREASCMIREGGAWRVVSDGRKYAGVGVRGRGILCFVLRFDVEDDVS